MREYCAYTDKTYLPQELALHESMEAHCRPYHLWVLALDEDTWTILARLNLPNVTTVHLGAVETSSLRKARTNRTWLEYMWTITPTWMLYVLHAVEVVAYMDSDCYFFGSPQQVFYEIGDAPLGITPHRFPDYAKKFEINGLYNVGMVYATRDGLPCIREWADQCLAWCYYRAEDGKYGDQKYLDPWPEKYRAHVIDHTGANLAPWNNEQYPYKIKDGKLRVANLPVLWFHFHRALNPAWPIMPTVRQTLYAEYAKALARANERLSHV